MVKRGTNVSITPKGSLTLTMMSHKPKETSKVLPSEKPVQSSNSACCSEVLFWKLEEILNISYGQLSKISKKAIIFGLDSTIAPWFDDLDCLLLSMEVKLHLVLHLEIFHHLPPSLNYT